jgi:hypothetical protein
MRDVSKLFARQDGVASTAQLSEQVPRGVVRQRIRTGEWERLGPGVVAVASADTWARRVRAAQLGAGPDAAVSHGTAARLHGLDGFDRYEPVHLTTCLAAHRTSVPGVTVHRSGLLEIAACDRVDGLTVVSRPVALLQIAGDHGRAAAARALDGMLRDGDSPLWIQQTVSGWRRRGVKGPATVLDLLAERVDRRLPASWFQRLTARMLQTRGLAMVDEYPVHDLDGRVLARLDLALPELRIGVECQSWQWHGTPTAQADDARRRRRLRVLGWEIVDVWWSDLGRADEVAEELVYLVTRRTAGRPLP